MHTYLRHTESMTWSHGRNVDCVVPTHRPLLLQKKFKVHTNAVVQLLTDFACANPVFRVLVLQEIQIYFM